MAAQHQSQDPLVGEEIDYPLDADETHNFDDAGAPEASDDGDDKPPPTLRLRVATWDVICTVVLTALLLYLATATTWPTRLFGFLRDVCVGETCGPVPYGVDMYIYPVVWGGIGAAFLLGLLPCLSPWHPLFGASIQECRCRIPAPAVAYSHGIRFDPLRPF